MKVTFKASGCASALRLNLVRLPPPLPLPLPLPPLEPPKCDDPLPPEPWLLFGRLIPRRCVVFPLLSPAEDEEDFRVLAAVSWVEGEAGAFVGV